MSGYRALSIQADWQSLNPREFGGNVVLSCPLRFLSGVIGGDAEGVPEKNRLNFKHVGD